MLSDKNPGQKYFPLDVFVALQAMKLIETAQGGGGWVLLSNCPLELRFWWKLAGRMECEGMPRRGLELVRQKVWPMNMWLTRFKSIVPIKFLFRTCPRTKKQ